MSKKALIVAACLLPLATAAQTVATVAAKVEGLVTVSQGQSVGLLESGTRLPEGSRVVTGSSGSAVLRVGPNCEVTLQPNQTLQIPANRACSEVLASVQSIAPLGTQLAGSSTPWLLTPTGLTTVALGAGLVGAVAATGRSGPVSGQ